MRTILTFIALTCMPAFCQDTGQNSADRGPPPHQMTGGAAGFATLFHTVAQCGRARQTGTHAQPEAAQV